jgi:hypothetical protein
MKRTSLPLHRREFFLALGGAAVVWPLAAPAQQSVLPVVGFINLRNARWNGALGGRLSQRAG